MYKSPESLPDFATKRRQHELNPRRLTFLLDAYEKNYQRMQDLLPNRQQRLRLASTSDAALPHLFFEPIEQTPYTETLLLTYRFPEKIDEQWQTLEEPSLIVRLFHDAKVAEVLKVGEHEHVALLKEFETDSGEFSQRRWQMNRLLNKWLTYLLQNDYR